MYICRYIMMHSCTYSEDQGTYCVQLPVLLQASQLEGEKRGPPWESPGHSHHVAAAVA